MIITLPITVLGLFLLAKRLNSPADIEHQQNSGQVEHFVIHSLIYGQYMYILTKNSYWFFLLYHLINAFAIRKIL